MADFSINGNNLFESFFNKIKPQEKTDDYMTVPMTSDVAQTSDVAWTNMLGVNITSTSQPNAEPYFTDEDLAAFVAEYATDISPETIENVTASMEGITKVNPEVLDAVPEYAQEAYVAHHVDGTADRVQNENSSRLFSRDIDEATGGDNTLLDVAGLMFYYANRDAA